MNLFIYEHLTSGANAVDELPGSLLDEGDSMLKALIRDLQSITTIQIITLRDSALDDTDIPGCQIFWVNDATSYVEGWQQSLAAADAALVIAPESDGTLVRLRATVKTANKPELGCDPSITQLCSDKLALAMLLDQQGFRTLPGQTVADYQRQPDFQNRQLVVKPRDGAGAVETYLLDARTDLERWLQPQSSQQFIVQPYIAGKAISLNAFFSHDAVHLLSCNRQQVTQYEQQLQVTASVPVADGESIMSMSSARKLLQDLQKALPGLWGFVGIDLILSETGPIIVEINPRLTSSYPAISATTGVNPGQLLSQHWHEKLNQGSS